MDEELKEAVMPERKIPVVDENPAEEVEKVYPKVEPKFKPGDIVLTVLGGNSLMVIGSYQEEMYVIYNCRDMKFEFYYFKEFELTKR